MTWSQYKEDHIVTVRDQLEAIAKELKQQDALIEPHVSDNDFAVEYGGMQKYQALIIRRLKVPKLELQKFSGNSLEETPHEHDACFVPECSANGQGSSSNEWHTWDWTKLQIVKTLDDVNAFHCLHHNSCKECCIEALEMEEMCSNQLV
ncbi:hypothetical protein HPB52_004155 [Rhipicephalus sanguineus]|uniref:Uncharacterized protein n=1 Tax=Rhipicephalus sanguineus TaxID=34632 RepID=A0A9D4SXJ3_RHISA|nr:hypothetical protein HPB52_004155 [Rhipicephalus sanguineus]